MKKSIGFSLGLIVIIFAGSCKKDDAPSIPVYTVASTYSFTNESDSNNVAKLLLMADQIGFAINLGSTNGVVVNAATLKGMFNGTGQFTDTGAYSGTNKLTGSGLSLAAICPSAMATDINRYFDSIALFSQSSTPGSHGAAGTALSVSNKKYLLSAGGIFYSQLFKKAINEYCSYQIANVYLADSINVTSDTAKLGHYWDRAFAFFAVPNNFPTVTKGKYLGSYCNQVNPGMGSNASIMNAFLKGRAAINNKDFAAMKTQAKVLLATLDTLNAACVVQEMHETETNIAASDVIASCGTMGETLGFIRNFTYNTGTRVITDAQITNLLKLVDAANPSNPDLYNFVNTLQGQTPGPLSSTEIIAKYIQQVYKFTDAQLPLL